MLSGGIQGSGIRHLMPRRFQGAMFSPNSYHNQNLRHPTASPSRAFLAFSAVLELPIISNLHTINTAQISDSFLRDHQIPSYFSGYFASSKAGLTTVS